MDTEAIEILLKINELQYWQLATVMFVAGFLPILAFFLGKGDE